MTVLNFPTPTYQGQTFLAQNGITYTWDGEKWTVEGAQAGSIGYILPPASNSRLGGVTVGTNINVDLNGVISIPNQTQADWNETDSTHIDYIKNKPTNVSAFTNDANYITSTSLTWNNITNAPNFAVLPTSTAGYLYNNGTGTLSWNTPSVGNGSTLVNGSYEVILGSDGVLSLPNGSTITDSIGTLSQGPAVDTQNINDTIGVFHGLDFTAPNGIAVGWTVNGPGVNNANIFGLDVVNGFVQIDSGVFQVGESYTFTGPAAGIAGVGITANSNSWTFGSDGVLTMPDGSLGGNGAINFNWEGYNWASISSSESTLNLYSLDVVGNGPKTNVRIGYNVELTTNALDSAYTWTFDNNGSLTVPTTTWSKTFSALLLPVYGFAPDIGPYGGDAWTLDVTFTADAHGVVSTTVAQIFPIQNNPGYKTGDTYTFTETAHGIAGYTLTIVLNNVEYPGLAGWTANVECSAPPVSPPTISSNHAIKISSNDHAWTFDPDGKLTFPDNLTIINGIIGKSISDTVTLETPGGTISNTTTVESQIEIDNNSIVIAKRTIQTVDDGISSATDENGHELRIDNTQVAMKYYSEPSGPNNSAYIRVSASNDGAMLEGLVQDVEGETYGRVTATTGAVIISNKTTTGTAKQWVFDTNGNTTLPNYATISSTDVGFKTTFTTNGDGHLESNENSITIGIGDPALVAAIIENPQNYLINFAWDSPYTFYTVSGITGPRGGTNVYTLTGTWPADGGAFPIDLVDGLFSRNGRTIIGVYQLAIESGGKTLLFDGDGNLKVPGNISFNSDTTGLGNSIDLSRDITISSGKNVIIKPGSSGVVGSTSWNFGENSLALPGGTTVTDTGGYPQLTSVNNFKITTDSTNNFTGPNIWEFDVHGALNLPNSSQIIGSQSNFIAQAADSLSFQITTSANSNEYSWNFGPDGTTTFPNDSLATASSLTVSTNYRLPLGPFTGNISRDLAGDGYVFVSSGDHDIFAGVTLSDLVGGTLTIAGYDHTILGVTFTGTSSVYGHEEYSVHITGPRANDTGGQGIGISIVNLGDTHSWQFGSDGVLTLPQGPYGYSRVQSTNGFNIDDWQFGYHGNNVLSMPVVPGTTYAQINAGIGEVQQPWLFGLDGSLTFPHGAGFGYGENRQLKVNDGVTLSLDFRDTSGRGFYTNSDGFSLRGDGDSTWKFGTDGNLTLPASGVIKNSDGTTYGASSWPVTNTTGSSGPTSVSIGQNASTGSGINSVAIGTGAKAVGNAVTSIGQAAGANFAGNEGIFLGHGADGGNQNGAIVINATGSTLTAVSGQNNSFYVAPIRNSNSPTNVLYYNTTTKEVTYGAAAVNYTLPTATSSALGGVKVGANISVTLDGTISVAAPFSGNYNDLTNKPTIGALSALNYVQVLGNTASPPSVSAGGTILSLTITTTGGPVELVGSGDANNASAAFYGTVQWYRGTTALGNQQFFESSSSNENQSVTQVFIDNPTAGTYTYYWKMPRSSATITFGEGTTAPVISAKELQGIQGAVGPQGPAGNATGSILVSTNASGDEGGEVDLAKSPNSSLSGSQVVIDQYIDRIRFFEAGGTTRGAYIDLTQAAAGVGTLLNNRVSAFVNAGTFVTMDNIKATVTTSGQRGLSLATVSGTATCYISGTYGMYGGATVGGASAGVALTTSASSSIFSWSFGSEGDTATYILNYGYTKAYRITVMIGGAYNNNMISIERLV